MYKKEEVGSFPPTDATTSAVCLNKPKCDWSMKQKRMKKTLFSAAWTDVFFAPYIWDEPRTMSNFMYWKIFFLIIFIWFKQFRICQVQKMFWSVVNNNNSLTNSDSMPSCPHILQWISLGLRAQIGCLLPVFVVFKKGH